MNYTLFIFRRDLRLIDNKGLIYAMNNFENIIPIFIFTPEQITNENKYKSDNAIQFMCESLNELNLNLKKNNSKLHLFYGDNIKVIKKIIKTINVKNIIFNMDYTPYALQRDKNIEHLCKTSKINCYKIEDYLMANIGTFLKKDNTPYEIYTPFKNNVLKFKIDKPIKNGIKNLMKTNGLDIIKMIDYKNNKNIIVNGGRKNGLKMLNKIKNHKKYNDNRNFPNVKTTLLSAFIKFGCISIREVYWKIKNEFGLKNELLNQIIWREFYFYIAYYYPRVLKNQISDRKNENFNEKYNDIKWSWSKNNYEAWCKGETGYPIVDAGMRELNQTGFMHNRCRLITSNFLNRLLNIDWRWSEIYYAQKLIDYDPAVNSGNHQWVASVGVDPKPYFQRLFNPWLQSEKYDVNAEYIKKWIPELKNVESNHIHNWNEKYVEYPNIKYTKPIIDYNEARLTSIQTYKKMIN